MERNDLPLGFSYALAQNPNAMKAFINMPQLRQQEVLQQVHSVSSKNEMKMLVNRLAGDS